MSEQFNIKEFIDTIESKEFRKEKGGYRAQFFQVKSSKLAAWHINRSFRQRKEREDLCEALHDTRIAKGIIKVVNEGQETGYGFPLEFVVVLKDVIDTQRRKVGDDEILQSYEICINKILKKEIKELSKIVDIPKELAYELLVALPTSSMVSRKNIIGIYVNRINRKLYIAEQKGYEGIDRLKTIRQIYKYLFGGTEHMGEIAISILLERRSENDKSTTNVFSLLTVFALDTLEKLDKEELRECLTRYAERRKNEREGERRIRLSSGISPADYPRITKAIKKISKKNEELKDMF